MTDESARLGEPAAGAASAPSLPATVDRATFQAELDALRVQEKAYTREGDAIATLPCVRAPRRRVVQDRIPPTALGVTAMDPKGEQTAFVYTTYIQETPERVWQGLTESREVIALTATGPLGMAAVCAEAGLRPGQFPLR
jgi:hypothetical protein